MPTYQYECAVCERQAEEFKRIDDRKNGPECCGGPMELVIGARYVRHDIEPYFDDNLQTYVKSRQHRKSVMREQGVYDRRDLKGTRWRQAR